MPQRDTTLHTPRTSHPAASQGEGAAHWEPLPTQGRFCLLTLDELQHFTAEAGCSLRQRGAVGAPGRRRQVGWKVAGKGGKGEERVKNAGTTTTTLYEGACSPAFVFIGKGAGL